jgi:fatty acid omega-hydroxylase
MNTDIASSLTSTMTANAAFAEAMKFENRWNPYPYFDQLRMTPVARVGKGVYVVTGYRELVTLIHDPRLSSDGRYYNSAVARLMGPEVSVPDPLETEAPGSMILTDPPDHDRIRRQAMRHFGPPHSPHVIPDMEPECQRIVNDLLDKARAKSQIDVVDDFAYRLPVTVIFKILGIPLSDEPKLHAWIADGMEGIFDVEGVENGPEATTEEQQRRREKGQQSGAQILQYLNGLIQGYAKQPGDGMISQMVNDNGPGGRMSARELVENTALLLVAGHDSTVNLIAHCVLTALRNPGSIDLLRGHPDLIPRAVEEALRLESSVQSFPSRSALADIEIGGTVIPKGSPVILLYGAANRDPKRFPNPNQFDPERKDNEHVGWSGGIHVCFGGPLARLEVNTAFEAFVRRVVNPRLVVDPPPYRRSQVFRGPRHLLVDIDGIRE